MRQFLLVAAVSVSVIACGPREDPTLGISFVELLANKERYIGKRVAIVGYYVKDDGWNLYLTKEHARIRDYSSGIRVIYSLSLDHCPEDFAVVEGRFSVGDGLTIEADRVSIYVDNDTMGFGPWCDGREPIRSTTRLE